MKVKNISDIEGLFNVIDKCTGKVELVCNDMRLNLKSKLAQYFSMAEVFSGGNEIPELEIIAYNQDDVNRIIDFMVMGA